MADISKIKLSNNTIVNIKDAQSRTDLATLLGTHALAAIGAAGWLDIETEISTSSTDGDIATAKATKNYVDAQVGAINKFDVVIADSLPTPAAEYMYKIYLIPSTYSTTGNVKLEYIEIRSGSEGSYTYAWEQIGSTETDLTGYVKKTTTIAGIDLQDDITVSELQVALGLGKLAYKDSASGSTTLDTIDSITFNDLTVSGNASVTTTATAATLTKASYTPAGTIAAKTNGDFDALTSAAFKKTATGGVQIEGSNSSSNVTITPSTDTFVKSLKTGTIAAATFTEGTFTPASISDGFFSAGTKATYSHSGFSGGSLGDASTSSFATEGITASVGTGDDSETLIFSTASTSNAVTAQGTFTAAVYGTDTFDGGTLPSIDSSKFDGGSKGSDSFSAQNLPVVNETSDAWTGYTTATAAAQTFTGDSYYIDTSTDKALKDVAFTGTEVADALVTGVTYQKANSTAEFSDTVTPTTKNIVRTAKTIDITVE